MADDAIDDELREMAEHRGFRLVKSRRRKAGVGDYGKFGLTDAKGKPLLGIGDNGLTASAAEIQDYLRTGTLSTWKQSADSTPDPPKARAPAATPDARKGRGAAPLVETKRASARKTPQARPGNRPEQPPAISAPTKQVLQKEAEERVHPADPPAAVLMFRRAKPGDAAAVAPLLANAGIIADETEMTSRWKALTKAGGGIVAELGQPIGCCLWTIVPTMQRGFVGRISLLFVAEAHRRQKIGSQLLEAADRVLAAKGCVQIEVMSDIEIRNAHNFFRNLNFEQTSYRFARAISAG